jgi:hypothetical protein
VLGTHVAAAWVVSRLITTTLGLIGLALTPLGCYATAGAYTDAEYVEAEYVPPRVDVYPRYVYEGRTVYLIDGRWYYRRGPHWVYYRREPPTLYRQRVYVERAPRAPDRFEARRHYRRHPYRYRD